MEFLQVAFGMIVVALERATIIFVELLKIADAHPFTSIAVFMLIARVPLGRDIVGIKRAVDRLVDQLDELRRDIDSSEDRLMQRFVDIEKDFIVLRSEINRR